MKGRFVIEKSSRFPTVGAGFSSRRIVLYSTISGTLCGASIVVWGTVPAKQQEQELRFKTTLITIPKL